jgi:hypothetical protein
VRASPASETGRPYLAPLKAERTSLAWVWLEGEPGLRCDGWRMKLLGVHWDGRRWRVILRIDRKSEHVGYFGLLWSALICANYHIAYLGLNLASEAIEDASGLDCGEAPEAEERS